MATTMWKCLHGSDAPEALSAKVTTFGKIHDHNTRAASSNKCQKPSVRLNKGQRSFPYQSVQWWNQLPASARTAATSTECRNIVYHHLLSKDKKEDDRKKGKASFNNYSNDAFVWYAPKN